LGFAEGSANPAGMKVVATWFPASERGLAGGVYNIGASIGTMLAPPLVAWAILAWNWRAAFVITGALGLAWVAAGRCSTATRTGTRRSPTPSGG
jgi:ACS family hexuronate transporter-like MFS transporter